MDCKVAILLPVYNADKYIAEQIESILKQTYKSWILLIYDDGSSDNSLDIIKSYTNKYPEKIILLPYVDHFGAKESFAYLISYVREAYNDIHYFMFCDHDDVWIKEKVSITLSKIKEMEIVYGNKIPLLVHTDLFVTNSKLEAKKNISFWSYAAINPGIKEFNRLLVQNNITGCTVMFNRRLLCFVKTIPKDAIMHDWWLALIASAFGEIDYINTPTVFYRQHSLNTLGATMSIKQIIFNGFSIRSILRNIYCIIKVKGVWRQAIVFWDTFKNQLDPVRRETLIAFLEIPQRFCLRRMYLLFKYRFLKHNFIANIIFFIFVCLYNYKFVPHLYSKNNSCGVM